MTQAAHTPGSKAFIEHQMEDGRILPVMCDVEDYSADLDAYWISYEDPEDSDAVIADWVDGGELIAIPKATGSAA